ncbi:hypothetical protein [Thalassobius sp. Cn5-15]|nr:hypothetical protein [Thalassobius sp. Cn5-15]MCG7492419.1 hypothetical protein [Thalassobius sp. Cn5-15]
MNTTEIIMRALNDYLDDPMRLLGDVIGAASIFIIIPLGLTLAAMFGG